MRHARLALLASLDRSWRCRPVRPSRPPGPTRPAPSKTPPPSAEASAGAERSRPPATSRSPRPGSSSSRPPWTSRRRPRSRSTSTTRTPGTPHDIVIHKGDVNGEVVFKGEQFNGVKLHDLRRPGPRGRHVRLRLLDPPDAHDRGDEREVTPAGEQLCYTDAYARRVEARVAEVAEGDAPLVILDRTTFYPGGGGQPSDRGVLLRSRRRPDLDRPGRAQARRRDRPRARAVAGRPARRSATPSRSTSSGPGAWP